MSDESREKARRQRSKESLRRTWKLTGSLYSDRVDAWLTRAVRAAFAEEFGPTVERTTAPIDVMEAWESGYQAVDVDHAMTLEDVGAVLGISRQAVAAIETKALAKMRRALERLHGGQDARGRS